MKHLRACLKDDSGQVVIVTVLCMVMLMGFLGFAIDMGHLRQVRRQTQALADAAAMAGGLEIRICAATASCPAMQAAVKAAMTENKQTAAFLMNCATPGTGLTVTLNDPPCALGSKDPNQGNTKYVEAVVTQEVRTYFARIVGFDHVKISARAEAKRGVDPCIWALNPHAGGAITAIASLGLTSTCGVVDESDSSKALTCLIGLVNVPKINVTGNVLPLLCGSTSPVNRNVPVPTPADPMAYLNQNPPDSGATNCPGNPPLGATTFSGSGKAINILLAGNYTFNPGIYCGGINITASLAGNITFTPGTYILRDGPGLLGPLSPQGGLNITAPLITKINGTGVLFYNEGNVTNPAASVGSFSVTAPLPTILIPLDNINLTAKTSGPYGGVLFWQKLGVTTTGTYMVNLFNGGRLEGAIYQPSSKVAYAVGVVGNAYNILVADQINFTGQVLSTVGSNYSALANGSPLHGDTAVLIQ